MVPGNNKAEKALGSLAANGLLLKGTALFNALLIIATFGGETVGSNVFLLGDTRYNYFPKRQAHLKSTEIFFWGYTGYFRGKMYTALTRVLSVVRLQSEDASPNMELTEVVN